MILGVVDSVMVELCLFAISSVMLLILHILRDHCIFLFSSIKNETAGLTYMKNMRTTEFCAAN